MHRPISILVKMIISKRIKIDNYQLDFDYDGTEYDFTVSADIKFDDAADTPPGN